MVLHDKHEVQIDAGVKLESCSFTMPCHAINGRRVVFQYIYFSQLCKLDISVCGDVQRCKEQASKNDVINASRVHDVHDTGGFDLTTPTHSSFQYSSCIDDGHFRSFSDPLYHDHSESKRMPRANPKPLPRGISLRVAGSSESHERSLRQYL